MERGLILLTAAVVLFVTPGVKAQLTPINTTEVNITRTGCGTTKVCIETPDDCDPAGNSTCLFASTIVTNRTTSDGVEIAFELSGNSSGYIALGLTTNLSEGNTTLFICAQVNKTFRFKTRSRDNSNGAISSSDRKMTDVRGMINGTKIQCEFKVAGLNASSSTTRDAHITSFFVRLGNGPYNGSVGPFDILLNSTLLNLAVPTSNLATTPATTTVSASETLHSQAMLFLLSILTMSVLQTI